MLTACSEATEQHSVPSISKLHGQWVVVNYQVKWCRPCIREIPELDALDHNYATVNVLGVNYDGAEGDDLASRVRIISYKDYLTEHIF